MTLPADRRTMAIGGDSSLAAERSLGMLNNNPIIHHGRQTAFVPRRSSKEQFTIRRNGKAENGHFHSCCFCILQNRTKETGCTFCSAWKNMAAETGCISLPNLAACSSIRIQSILAARGANMYHWHAAVIYSSILPTHH